MVIATLILIVLFNASYFLFTVAFDITYNWQGVSAFTLWTYLMVVCIRSSVRAEFKKHDAILDFQNKVKEWGP